MVHDQRNLSNVGRIHPERMVLKQESHGAPDEARRSRTCGPVCVKGCVEEGPVGWMVRVFFVCDRLVESTEARESCQSDDPCQYDQVTVLR